MFQSCFRILTPLLILWQLILPCCAKWLHGSSVACCALTVSGDACHSAGGDAKPHSKRSCSCSRHGAELPQSDPDSQERQQKPHDCSNCAVCQAIAAPRTLATIVALEASGQIAEALIVADCSDPLLGFDLPTRCRAPPVIGEC